MHEVGHGLYEHGGAPELDRTPLATGCSSALHESQSRLWENVIGRSLPFWRWFYPQFQRGFASTLADVPLERLSPRDQPGATRRSSASTPTRRPTGSTSSCGSSSSRSSCSAACTADLPEAWNAKMEELLGVRPPNDRVGCLQDVHWSGGMFGYFPTYQLGNVLSVQIWERLIADIPDAYEQVERGSFGAIYDWLREQLYRQAASSRRQR